MEPVDSLFRHESGRMISVLTRVFGFHNLALAEDVVQDAFCQALEVWKFRGPPDDPSAWLMAVAKRRAIDVLRRERTARTFGPELGRLAESEWTLVPAVEQQFAPHAIQDDLLRMMFSCCDPRLKEEAQVALILHILCGFSVGEVAAALVARHAAIEKRLTRAKKLLAGSKRLFEVANARDVAERLPIVQRALYLLFNEGYHGASAKSVVRGELCREAIRLGRLLVEVMPVRAEANALLALMLLNDARRNARTAPNGDAILLEAQDRARWDKTQIAEGLERIEAALRALVRPNTYAVQAAIAALHMRAPRYEDTDWPQIAALYEVLIRIHPSPVVELNHAVAVSMVDGPERALRLVDSIAKRGELDAYHMLPAVRADLLRRLGRRKEAIEAYQQALKSVELEPERRFIAARLGELS